MIKEIYLATGLYDNKILTLADNENLQLKLKGMIQPNLTYYIKARNGGKFYNKRIIDGIINFDRKELVYGKFQAKIVALANENVVKEFDIEDLILKELDGKLKVLPELEEVKSEFAVVKAENEQLKTKVAELEKLCKDTKTLVLKLNDIAQGVE